VGARAVSADANVPEDIDGPLQALTGERVDVIIVLQTSILLSSSQAIATAALAKRLANRLRDIASTSWLLVLVPDC
jgi:hypothetical protein